MTREEVHEALFELLKTAAPFATASRRLKHYTEVPPESQPALFLCAGNDHSQSLGREGGPTTHNQDFLVVLYANSSEESGVAPSTAINPLIDAVVALFDRANGMKQTLGGRVQRAMINTTVPIETDEGVLGDQALAAIPLSVLLLP